MPRTTAKAKATLTTAQQLGSLIKSARDIMRKDKGLNGDLDRLPLLTWIMFLKFLDDLELQREEEAALSGRKFKTAIESPYRWRDWAADPQGITGDELLSFINAEEGFVFALRLETDIEIGTGGIGIKAGAIREINTSDTTDYVGVAAGTTRPVPDSADRPGRVSATVG